LVIGISAYCQNKVVVKANTSAANAYSTSFSVYNVKLYGAVGDNSTTNTTAIQAAINDCHASNGGIVYVPSGIYKTGKLTSYTNVSIKGDGYVTSSLKSITADTMIVIQNLQDAINGVDFSSNANVMLDNIRLDGDSVGNIGFYANRAANFMVNRVMFYKFRSKGMVLHNSLIGSVNDCYFWYNNYGIYGFADVSNNTATTHVKINNCVINYCKKWAVEWQNGGMLTIDHGDMEVNGSTTDTATGCVYYHNNSWPVGLIVKDTWLEENLGTCFWIGPNVNNSNFNYPVYVKHSFENVNDQGHHYGFTQRNIYVMGANQNVNVSNSEVFGAGHNIIVDGTNNTVTYHNTTFDATPSNLARGSGATITSY
jgi:hypothetical protein